MTYEKLPISISIEDDGKILFPIAKAGEELPLVCTRAFSVSRSIYKDVTINIYAGERPLADNCKKIGAFALYDVEVLKYNKPLITIELRIDRELNILVDAFDEGGLRGAQYKIAPTWLPNDTEMKNMQQEEEVNIREDENVRKKIMLVQRVRESLFDAEAYLYSKKKKIPDEKKKRIKKKMVFLYKKIKKYKLNKDDRETDNIIVAELAKLNTEIAS